MQPRNNQTEGEYNFCQNKNQAGPTFVDMIQTQQYVYHTPSILLCFLFKVLMIISEQELQIILSKVTFSDPNERLLWDSAAFRQASIGNQLASIMIGVGNVERLVKQELADRFEIEIPPQYNWIVLRDALSAMNPANGQMNRQECMIYNLENQ